MNELPRCPKCDCQLPSDAPAGLCPKCLVKAGFESQPAQPGDLEPTLRNRARSGFEPPSIEELAGRFPQLEILELIGKGGMGAVYKARQRSLDRLVALKILPLEIGHDETFAERFTREARALARLTHNQIVSIFDFGQTDGLFYIVMEFVDGANLRQAIRTGTLTPAEALAIVPQICEALQFAHDEGIVHRDIKPENILIDKRGRVKIADFGLAKLLGQDASDQHLTATHQVMGTLRYMAPEQMQGSREVDHRADIYSLGVVFYELLTGELPMGKFAPPSKRVQVDVRLDEIVLRALEQEPELRYQHASEVKTDVETISRESQSPNLAAQRFACRDNGRTSLAEPVSLPFEIAEKVHWDLFGEVHGKLRLGKNELVVEFEVRSLFPAFRSGLKEVSISFDEIESVNWDGWDLTLCTKSMKALAEIPKSSRGQVAFDLSMTDLDVPGGISESVEHFLACLPSRLVGKSASEAGPVSAKGAATEAHLAQSPADCLLLAAGIAFVTACGVAMWLGVTASEGKHFNTSMIRGNLIGMSAGLAIYSVFVGVASLMLRRLQARFFVLLVAVIVGLFIPAVCALNVVMELRNIPVWPVVIPLWIGMPAALWVVVRLFRDDVRGAFDAAAEQRRLCDGSKPPQQNLSFASEPRFSRFAIAGAVWALLGLLAIIPTLYFIGLNRVWNGTALPTDLIHSEPPLVFSIFMGALLAIGSGAPIGTTIYGAIAIGHIKRSGGKIIGLPLAVADVLFFPLLVLSGPIAALVARVGYSMAPHPNAAAVTSAGAFGVLIALSVCFFVARAAWRAVARHEKQEDSTGTNPVSMSSAAPSLLRPKLVPVLATFNLAGAMLLMLVCAMEEPAEFARSVPRLWRVWETVDAVLGFSMATGMFAASIGLFLWKPWARKLTLGVCVFGLASFVFDAPYLARFLLPDAWADVQQVVIAEGVEPKAQDFVTLSTIVVLFGGMLVVGLTCLIGQLVYFTRPRVVAAFESPTLEKMPEVTQPETGQGIISLRAAISGVVLPALLLIGSIVLSIFVSIPDGAVIVCFLLGVGLELVAVGCGIVSRRSPSGKAGLITGSVSLVLWLAILAIIPTHTSTSAFTPDGIVEYKLAVDSPPPLGTITSGIGAEFTVPAGQVAVFEVVTRRDSETVPIPPHCGYVMAPPDTPLAGTFRWSRKPDGDSIADGGQEWSLEILTAGGGRVYSETTRLPEELNEIVGASGLGLGLLEPNVESIHWGTADANDLPANGLIGLRVTVMPHGLKAGGSGIGDIDWKESQTKQSTSHRRIPTNAP